MVRKSKATTKKTAKSCRNGKESMAHEMGEKEYGMKKRMGRKSK